MNGAEVRALREQYGMARPEICEMTEGRLTVAKLAGIELGRVIRPDEQQVLQEVFDRLRAERPYTSVVRDTEKRETLKLADKKERSDPELFTAANPSINAKLKETTQRLQGGRNRKAYVAPETSRFIKRDEWNNFKAGDLVRVMASTWDQPHKANWLNGTFTFTCHVTDTSTGKTWIDVKGGKPGHILQRSFTEERVQPFGKKRAT